MAITTPGFTYLNNLDQNNTDAIDILSNLLSSETTNRFSVIKGEGSDLQVFQNNINSETDFTHFNRSLQGEQHYVRSLFTINLAGRVYFTIARSGENATRLDLTPNIVIEFNGESFSPAITPTVFDRDGFIDINGNWDFQTVRNDVHLFYNQWIGIPRSYFSNSTASPVGPLSPISINDPINIFDTTDVHQNKYNISFTENDELKIQVPSGERTFTESDNIIRVTLDKDLSLTAGGSFTISGSDIDDFNGEYEYDILTDTWQNIDSPTLPDAGTFIFDLSLDKWTYSYNGNTIVQTIKTTYPFTSPNSWHDAVLNDAAVTYFNSATFDATNAILADTDTVFEGEFTIKDYEIDRDTEIKSFVIGGLQFSDSPDNRTDVQNAFDRSSIRITRKNGVSKENFINALEYGTELYEDADDNPVKLFSIDKNKTYNQIFDDIESNIINAQNKIRKLIIRREDNKIFDSVRIEGIARFKDTIDEVTESDSEISNDAAGLFLIKSDIDASPVVLKRAFSEISDVWEVDDATNNIQIQSARNITKASIAGPLTFEESINIDVDNDSPNSDDGVIDALASAEANGATNGFVDGIGIPADGRNDVFTHRIILEVEEIDEDGDLVTVEYGLLAIKQS